jgi:beta-mannosidase
MNLKKSNSILLGSLLFVLVFISGCSDNQNISIEINKDWEFHQVGKPDWNSATVPGEVHTDLLKNNLIPDPFYRDNEKKMVWIEKKDWEYKTAFEVTSNVLEKKNNLLVFDGLDTYATVYLNDRQVLKADNMFRQWSADVKPYLKEGKNELRVVFK